MNRKLFIITNRKLIKKGDLYTVTEACVQGGADAIILREKDLSSEELYITACRLKKIINNKIPLIINGNYDVAVRCKTEGVHLSYDIFIKFNNKYNELKGVSIHSLEEAKMVNNMNADYILTGHIFNTACKAGLPGRGIEFLKDICGNLSLPVIAIGGIDENNINSVLEAGASGAAIMSSVMEADNPKDVVYKMKSIINNF